MSGEKGDQLELLTAAFFQAHGFFVRRGVMLSVAAGAADATDIDLLALRYTQPLKEERLVADCKYRKRGKPFERVLWTMGLSQFARAGRSVVVSPAPIPAAREFAAQGHVEMIAADRIRKHLASPPFPPFGDADPVIADKLQSAASSKGVATKEINRERARLRQMLVVGNCVTNLNRAIIVARQLRRTLTVIGPKEQWLRDYACKDAAVVCTVMLLRFAEEANWFPDKDWKSILQKRLTYGDVRPSKAVRLAQIALDKEFPNGLPAPEFADELAGAVEAIIQKPDCACLLPNSVEYLLFHADDRLPFHGQDRSRDDEVIGLAKRVISALSYAVEEPNAFEWTNNIAWHFTKNKEETRATDLLEVARDR